MLAPLVARRAVAEGSRSSAHECPGESDCERFLTSAGPNQQEKVVNACTGCELFPTKPVAESDPALEWTMVTVERARRERDSGEGIALNEMSAAAWELVQLWDQIDLHYERTRTGELHEAMLVLLNDRA